MKAADVGVKHWSDHVQAQTDANHGDISATKMQATFKRTRLAGPADLARYDKALGEAKSSTGSCEAARDVPKEIRVKMASCADRRSAQEPVLAAARDGMHDWRSHLAAMRRSRMGHVHDAQGVWIKAWRAAPPHIRAYKSAKSSFDAPRC
jgi:hypothetical protein